MLYPSIQELLKLSEDENGNERLNKYTLVMATAKCARIITNETRVRKDAEKGAQDKRDYKKEYKDEKAVKSAVRELKTGDYKVVFEGDEDYDSAIVDVRALDAKLEEELLAIEEQEKLEKKKALEKDRYVRDFEDDEDTQDLMNASEVYTDEGGFDERYEDPSISPNN